MRYHLLAYIFVVLLLVYIIYAIRPSFAVGKRLPRPLVDVPHLRDEQRLQGNRELQIWLQKQQPIMDKIFDGMKPFSRKGGPFISDVLPRSREINVFASLTRDFESISSRLEDATSHLTVLAPRNSVIMGLPHKPWEKPDDYQQFGEMKAYEGQEGQDRAKRNLERFVQAHIISASPWKENEEVETLGGEKLKWSKDGDKIFIQPGNVEVERVAEQVSNGEVWILKGLVSYN